MKSPITTHVLDLANGHPAKGIPVILEILDDSGAWVELTHGETDDDGRITDWLPADEPARKGTYRITFEVEGYFDLPEEKMFYTTIPVIFELNEPDSHYHVPLLLSPYGYSTYRGS